MNDIYDSNGKSFISIPHSLENCYDEEGKEIHMSSTYNKSTTSLPAQSPPPSVTDRSGATTVLSIARNEERHPCQFCKRKFAPERLQKHEEACENASRKRPAFDMKFKRLPHLEYELNTRHSSYPKKTPISLRYPDSKWQKQHVDFLNNLHYARKLDYLEQTGVDVSNLKPPPSINDDYIQCPHCLRKYAPIPAERHIPKCKDIIHKPRPPPNITSSGVHLPDINLTSRRKSNLNELSFRNTRYRLTSKTNLNYSNISEVNEYNSSSDEFIPFMRISPQPEIKKNFITESEKHNSKKIIKLDNRDAKKRGNILSRLDSTSLNLTAVLINCIECQICGKNIQERDAEKHVTICSKMLRTNDSKFDAFSCVTDRKRYKKSHRPARNKTPSLAKHASYIAQIQGERFINTKDCLICNVKLPGEAKYCMMCGNQA